MNSHLRTLLDFERRIELLRGRVQVGGSQGATRFMLEQLLAQTSLADLRDLGGDRWRDAAQFTLNSAPVYQGGFAYRQHYDLLQRVSLPLFSLLKETALATYSRDVAVKLGDSVLTPDVFVCFDATVREYYLEGPPLLATEVVDSHNLREEFERLGIYAAARTPEVWWLEPERGCARQFVLGDTGYSLRTQATGWLTSAAVQGLELHLDEAWQGGRTPLEVRYQGRSSEFGRTPSPPDSPVREGLSDALREELLSGVLGVLATLQNEPDRGGFKADLPFAPSITLTPQPISFEAFISWTTEAKFELLGGRIVVGSDEGNKTLLGLLLMTFGLVEAFALLPEEVKGALRGVN